MFQLPFIKFGVTNNYIKWFINSYARGSIAIELETLPKQLTTSVVAKLESAVNTGTTACGASAIGWTPVKEGKTKDESIGWFTGASIITGSPTLVTIGTSEIDRPLNEGKSKESIDEVTDGGTVESTVSGVPTVGRSTAPVEVGVDTVLTSSGVTAVSYTHLTLPTILRV